MKNLELCGHTVRVNDFDLVSLTDMWKANEGKRKDDPEKFLKLKDTKEYIAALKRENPDDLNVSKDRQNSDIWANKMLSYKYACWIDPGFEVEMYSILDGCFSGRIINLWSAVDHI